MRKLRSQDEKWAAMGFRFLRGRVGSVLVACFQPQTQQVLVGTMKTPTNVPSQKNISQTRSTEAQGRVRAKMHMNHSVM